MGPVLVELIPLMLVAAFMPGWIIIVLLMLSGKGGLSKATAFALGSLLVRLTQGVLFGYVFRQDAAAYGETGPAIIKSTLLLVLGLLMLILAYLKWRKQDDPDAPPPKWMSGIANMSTGKAFGSGVLLMVGGMKQWVFTLAALATIAEAQLSLATAGLTYLIFMLAAASLMLIAIISYAIAPRRAGAALDAMRGWLDRNNRPITVGVSFIFGVLFMINGITGLMG